MLQVSGSLILTCFIAAAPPVVCPVVPPSCHWHTRKFLLTATIQHRVQKSPDNPPALLSPPPGQRTRPTLFVHARKKQTGRRDLSTGPGVCVPVRHQRGSAGRGACSPLPHGGQHAVLESPLLGQRERVPPPPQSRASASLGMLEWAIYYLS